MTQYELDWESIKGGENQELTPFLKLSTGETRVRIVGKPSQIEIHWEKGLDQQAKKIICLGHGCPVCKAGHAAQTRYQMQVIDRTDGKLKVLEGGVTIFNQVKAYAMDPDYGDPTRYDMKIKKEGTGRETKYTIMASPKATELKPEEKEIVASAKKLSDINKVKTVEEIMALGLELFSDSIADLSTLDNDFSPVAEKTPETVTTDDTDFDDWESI